MPKPKTVKYDAFFGGISDDIREQSLNTFSISKHFDIFKSPKILTPYRATGAIEDKDYLIKQILYADGTLWGYGAVSGADDSPKVFKVASPTDSSPSWATFSNNAITSSTRELGMFVFYKDYIYGFSGSDKLWRVKTDGTNADKDWKTMSESVTTACQGLVHPADDILYMAYNNIIAKNNDGTFTDSVLTLPSDMTITSMTPYGNYLAIAAKSTVVGGGNSQVYIWDRDSSLTTISDKIDWGVGNLEILENLQGVLHGITDDNLGSGSGKMAFKIYSGGAVRTVKEMPEESVSGFTTPATPILPDKVVVNNKLYFYASLGTEVGGLTGIWVVGRRSLNYPQAITLDFVEEDVSSTVPNVQSIAKTGDYWWINHSADGSVNRTSSTSTFYTNTSLVETNKITLGDSSVTKHLVKATVMTNPIPSGGQIVLKYKKDEETSWTTIFTHTTANSKRYTARNISGTAFPDGLEWQFKAESTGGVEITGLKFEFEIKDNDV